MDCSPSEPLSPPEQKRVLRIVPVMGKGAHMLNVTHNGRPVWGPKAVNGTLHHAALRCHTPGIQCHHWESMLLPWSSEPQQQRGPCSKEVPRRGMKESGTHTHTPTTRLPSPRLTSYPLFCPLPATQAREFPLTAFPSQSQDEREILMQCWSSWFAKRDPDLEEAYGGAWASGQRTPSTLPFRGTLDRPQIGSSFTYIPVHLSPV